MDLKDAPRFETTPRLETTQTGENDIDPDWGCDMAALRNEEHLDFRDRQRARAEAAGIEFEIDLRTAAMQDSDEKMVVTSEGLFYRFTDEAYEAYAEGLDGPEVIYEWIDPANLDALTIAYEREQMDAE